VQCTRVLCNWGSCCFPLRWAFLALPGSGAAPAARRRLGRCPSTAGTSASTSRPGCCRHLGVAPRCAPECSRCGVWPWEGACCGWRNHIGSSTFLLFVNSAAANACVGSSGVTAPTPSRAAASGWGARGQERGAGPPLCFQLRHNGRGVWR